MNSNLKLAIAGIVGATIGGLIGLETVVGLLLAAGAAIIGWRLLKKRFPVKN